MPEIVRYTVFENGTTTAGGKLEALLKMDTYNGFPMIREHDTVICPVCNTVGYVKCVPPCGRGAMRERIPAHEGDLCICACNPPPRLLAADHNFTVSYGTDFHHFGPESVPYLEHLGLNPADFTGVSSTHQTLSHDEQVRLVAPAPVAGIPFLIDNAGKTTFGYTEEGGLLPRTATPAIGCTYSIYWGDIALARNDKEI